ncbi:hypothetical protein [uncultured Maribacter sp.]|uniref:hypothetical protein n=1 Tax=uncultured Maribacter sp. TaxID=431308 RepID=UPI00261BD6D5|nr:hypothetical protein [uncultured Maribacter sp.]
MNTTITKSAGMGAVINDGAVTFRVWAPNAVKVFVGGSFNNWTKKDISLEIEENGYWSVITDKASEDDEYKNMRGNFCRETIRMLLRSPIAMVKRGFQKKFNQVMQKVI